jgi:peptidyl-prolyl cis-trans isomerase B (cyclophilin B)
MLMRLSCLAIACLGTAGLVRAEAPAANPGLTARVIPASRYVSMNNPIWVEFVVENRTNEAITLTVPGTEPAIPSPEVGLPLSHIFSGGTREAGVMVTTETGRAWGQPVGFNAPSQAPILLLAPHGVVGTTIDLREYFPVLRGAGQFRIGWRPYGGAVSAGPIMITVAPRKQVEIETDDGNMTVELFYDDAPLTVENFLDLAKSGFYTGKTFHRLEPGYLLQGGCPRGDGTGIRLDGKRVPAEFNQQSHEKGTLSMALLDDDPESGSCQFFISNTRQKDWDGRYTVFGRLSGAESMATLDRLMATSVDSRGRPTRPIVIRGMRISDAPITTVPAEMSP